MPDDFEPTALPTRRELLERRERSLIERYDGCRRNSLHAEADRVLEELALVQCVLDRPLDGAMLDSPCSGLRANEGKS